MSSQESTADEVTVQALFEPYQEGNLKLSNRIVMAPMTRGFSPNGVPGPDVADYYRRRAANGVGLIVTEGTLINHPAAAASPNWPNFHGDEALQGWAKVVEAVHSAGGRIIPQLWHVGTTRKIGSLPNPEALPVGPSGIDAATGEQVSEPLSEQEIASLVEAFAQAASDAKRIGFDGIEIHGAHGYLIDQFFWEKTNRRTDRYGGSLAARTLFATEVVKACRQAVGPDFPIVFRFSQWKGADYSAKLVQTPEELEQFLAPLAEAGVDVFHCSTRRFWEPEFEGSDLNLAGWTKKLTGKPTITVGSVGLDVEFTKRDESANTVTLDKLLDRLNRGDFDLVAVGRALLHDPEWAVKIRDGRSDELRPYSQESTKTLY
ncbi:NADH:flavin oxidoreductase [Cohnella faecalis]|uniref:12-oxophytodienoate reductase n=1 Tax=Cohnella faecalis TaxID=2315694 RepID=A0A398CLY8_9BACL|nr:NADH:flavin oxidoreductase [Cohnella faecalis]RIE03455.1 12-oxophytodienoate reductase [Cohnella faecalis]